MIYLIFFVKAHWFRKCNLRKNSQGSFWGRRVHRGQTTLKLKTRKVLNENSSKIDEIQNLALATSKMAFLTSSTSEGAQWIFPKNTFFKSGQSTEKNELSFLVKPDFYSASSRPPRKCLNLVIFKVWPDSWAITLFLNYFYFRRFIIFCSKVFKTKQFTKWF